MSLESFKQHILALNNRAREAISKNDTVSLQLETLLNWIISPREPVSDSGMLTPKVIHEELAAWLESQPSFARHCVIQREDNDVFLWRKKDWDRHIPVEVAKRELDVADTIERCEERERRDRVFVAMLEWGPLYKNNVSLARKTIETLIYRAKKEDKTAKETLTALGYYTDEHDK